MLHISLLSVPPPTPLPPGVSLSYTVSGMNQIEIIQSVEPRFNKPLLNKVLGITNDNYSSAQ